MLKNFNTQSLTFWKIPKSQFSYTGSHFWNFLHFLKVFTHKNAKKFQGRDYVLKFLHKNSQNWPFFCKNRIDHASTIVEAMYDIFADLKSAKILIQSLLPVPRTNQKVYIVSP